MRRETRITPDVIADLRQQAIRYPVASEQREAYVTALVRHEYADSDARLDAVIKRTCAFIGEWWELGA